MNATIDHYFTTMSPWAYIGFQYLLDMAQRTGATIRHRPMQLMDVFASTDTPPLAQRHETRRNLRIIELQRWRDKRGLKYVLSPAHWPFAFQGADKFVIAAEATGDDQNKLLSALFEAIWIDERDLGDETVLADIANAAGLNGSELLSRSKADDIAEKYAANTREAVAAGVFGSPSYLLNGEMFWGQDRIDLLEDAVRSKRAPYQASAQ